jgi:ATP/maltotriose-dependent transcriptional regulator MalT
MTSRPTCPEFVGREAELGRLWGVLSRAKSTGEGRLLVLTGDAGIGKTRLVGRLCDQASADGWLTATGGCVDLGEVGLAYGPLVEAVRRLRADLGEPVVDGLLDPDARRPGDGTLGALLAGGRHAGATERPGQVLEHVVGFLTRLGSTKPTVLVFEDLHWADRSTQDLVAYLSRNLPPSPLVIICTYRLDELHRRHPLRPLVAELHRNPVVEHLLLRGLDRAEIAALAEGVLGTVLDDEVMDELVARSEGNPFYVEELLAAGPGRPIQGTLRDVILTRIERLSEAAQSLLRRASVVGRWVDETQLAAVTGEDAAALADGLREALANQVLIGDVTGCQFRHALVQEAVYSELLPGERQRLHVAAAHAIEADAGLVDGPTHVRQAVLAHHWGAAHDLPRCLTASKRAAESAEVVGAFAEAAAHYERVLELWDQVEDAVSLTATAPDAIIMRAASALHLAGRSARAATMAHRALEMLGDAAEPEDRAAIMERIGQYWWTAGNQARSIAAYEQATALLSARPSSPANARAMAALGQSLMVRSQLARAERTLRTAIDSARSAGDRATEGHAMCSLGAVLGDLGRLDEAVAAFEEALAIAEEVDAIEEKGRARVNLSAILPYAARCEEAAAVASAGLDHAAEAGLIATYGQVLAANGAHALIRLGRWDEALDVLARAGEPSGGGRSVAGPGIMRAAIATRRGDWAIAEASLALALDRTAASNDLVWRGTVVIAAAELACEQGRHGDAQQWAQEAVELAENGDSATWGMPAYAIAMRVIADRAQALNANGRLDGAVAEAREEADRLLKQARELSRQPQRLGGVLLLESEAWLATIEADASRAQGRSDPDRWAEVAERWEAQRNLYPMAEARFREAEAVLLARGSRTRATRVLAAAADIAVQLRAEPLAQRVRTLARQARLKLDAPKGIIDGAPEPYARLGLTAREVEVLALVAEGLTNREIGSRLFISHKTASVHVSNLLRKLSVDNRAAARDLARRLGGATPRRSPG